MPTTYTFLSDLHLSQGSGPASGETDRREEFFFDEQFARFIDHLVRQAGEDGQHQRLVLLGDTFDFLRVAPPPGSRPPDTSEKSTFFKLDQIAAGHPRFFEALGKFISSGFALDVLPGNHDIELVHPAVQDHLRRLILSRTNGSNPGTIAFHPWIYYIPGLLYAEHGQQYHDINSFHTLLAPFQPAQPDQVELPPGSHLEDYLYRLGLAVLPSARSQPPFAAILRALLRQPALWFRLIPLHIHTFITILACFSRRSGPQAAARSASYRSDCLVDHAREIGLKSTTLTKLDRLSSTSFFQFVLRLFRKSHQKTSRPAVKENYLYRAGLKVQQLLAQDAAGVPFYIFGHSHQAIKYPFDSTPQSWYLNCGSWTARSAPQARQDSGENLFTYSEVREKDVPAAQVCRWNDPASISEPYSFPAG